MTRIVSFFTVLAALALAATASAQVQTGSILVRAADQQGALVPGVTITISSPVLVAGSMSGVTDAGGVNRFPSLIPGTYTVKLELSGFTKTDVRPRYFSSADRTKRSIVTRRMFLKTSTAGSFCVLCNTWRKRSRALGTTFL